MADCELINVAGQVVMDPTTNLPVMIDCASDPGDCGCCNCASGQFCIYTSTCEFICTYPPLGGKVTTPTTPVAPPSPPWPSNPVTKSQLADFTAANGPANTWTVTSCSSETKIGYASWWTSYCLKNVSEGCVTPATPGAPSSSIFNTSCISLVVDSCPSCDRWFTGYQSSDGSVTPGYQGSYGTLTVRIPSLGGTAFVADPDVPFNRYEPYAAPLNNTFGLVLANPLVAFDTGNAHETSGLPGWFNNLDVGAGFFGEILQSVRIYCVGIDDTTHLPIWQCEISTNPNGSGYAAYRLVSATPIGVYAFYGWNLDGFLFTTHPAAISVS